MIGWVVTLEAAENLKSFLGPSGINREGIVFPIFNHMNALISKGTAVEITNSTPLNYYRGKGWIVVWGIDVTSGEDLMEFMLFLESQNLTLVELGLDSKLIEHWMANLKAIHNASIN